MTVLEAVHKILLYAGKPLHYKNIADEIRRQKLVETCGKNFSATVRSVLSVDVKKSGQRNMFIRVGPGEYDLRSRQTIDGPQKISKMELSGKTNAAGNALDDSTLRSRQDQKRKPMTVLQAIRKVLRDAKKPLHYERIAEMIIQQKLVEVDGRSFPATVRSLLSVDVKRNRDHSTFKRTGPGEYDLRSMKTGSVSKSESLQDESIEDGDVGDEFENAKLSPEIRTAYYPRYDEVRHLLNVWSKYRRKLVTLLQSTIRSLQGTPRRPVDWRYPDEWIDKRIMDREMRKLAIEIWAGGKGVNPRHTYGHWLLSNNYGLLDEDSWGQLLLTERGKCFIDNHQGMAVQDIDDKEGVANLLSFIADRESASVGDLEPDWQKYLVNHRSPFQSSSTVRDTLRRRLTNLLERKLIYRKGINYVIAEDGKKYLRNIEDGEERIRGENTNVRISVEKSNEQVRSNLRDYLHEMDPIDFEHLIKQLLECMGYVDVEVTKQSGDSGVDVVASIKIGFTTVKEVVQVKRYRKLVVQKSEVNKLRGALQLYDAVQGTIVTTSRFTSGAKDIAAEERMAPITLVDINHLMELLVEHGIGIRRYPFEVLSFDVDSLANLDRD